MRTYSKVLIALMLLISLTGCRSQNGGNSVAKSAADKYDKTYKEEREHQKKVMDEASSIKVQKKMKQTIVNVQKKLTKNSLRQSRIKRKIVSKLLKTI